MIFLDRNRHEPTGVFIRSQALSPIYKRLGAQKMLRMLSLFCAAGALLAVASTANAASECRGGYRELPNGVIVSCHGDSYDYEPAPLYAVPPVYVVPQIYVERPRYYRRDWPYYYDRYDRYDRRYDNRRQRDGYYSAGPCGGFGQPACRNRP
jgi:hypothetical protein